MDFGVLLTWYTSLGLMKLCAKLGISNVHGGGGNKYQDGSHDYVKPQLFLCAGNVYFLLIN